MTWQEELTRTFDNTIIDDLKQRTIGQLLTELETKFNQYKQENLLTPVLDKLFFPSFIIDLFKVKKCIV